MRYGLYFKLFDRRVYAICIYVYPRICIRIRYKVMFRGLDERGCVMVAPAARKSFASEKSERETESERGRKRERKNRLFLQRGLDGRTKFL